jgi:ABC-type dipeptide/oligopeptide/nickel transport system ATPase component
MMPNAGHTNSLAAKRIAIARALSIEPSLLICDEPTSALDVSVQAKILNLLKDLQQDRDMAIVMVTHDLAVAVRTCDRIAVMDQGRIVEDRPAQALAESPQQPATASLVAASQ